MDVGLTYKRIDYQSVDGLESKEDALAVEQPLEIRLSFPGERPVQRVAVTMRTPGEDIQLALGFLYNEGIIDDFSSVNAILQEEENIVRIQLEKELPKSQKVERNFYMTSSCGVCGKSAIEEILINNDFTPINSHLTLTSSQIFSLKDKVLSRQKLFADTGGIHAAALFNAHVDLIRVCEDVGRHNALDKLGGYYFKEKTLPLSKNILLLSGRISFELVQKAGMLGIPIIIAVGAPSSLAVELAEEQNQTLVGFLKKDSFNIYTHNERIKA